MEEQGTTKEKHTQTLSSVRWTVKEQGAIKDKGAMKEQGKIYEQGPPNIKGTMNK